MSDTREEKNEGTPPSCEYCGEPATRKANLSIDVHWYDIIGEEGWYDGDTLVEIRDMYLCDGCDVCWDDIPEEEIERMGAHFAATGQGEEAGGEADEEKTDGGD
jgi:hypothetical protein